MKVGIIGIIALTITLLLLLKNEYYVLCIVFFSSFCTSYVIETNSLFLQPGHYFIIILLISAIITTLVNNKKILIYKPNRFVLWFIVIAFLSITYSKINSIDVLIYGIGNKNQLKSSLVSRQNYSQFAYLFLGFVSYVMIITYGSEDIAHYERIKKWFGISGICIIAIGLYQIVANRLNLPFDVIFRNDIQELWQTKNRVQATMNEASILGQYLGFVFAYALGGGYSWVKSKTMKMIIMFFILIVGIMTLSSTFILVTMTSTCVYIVKSKYTKKTFMNYIACGVAVAFLLFGIYRTGGVFTSSINNAISKLLLHSKNGIVRWQMFKYTMAVGLKHFFLGVGYGGGRSTDVYSSIFATMGLAGIVSYFAIWIDYLRKRKKGSLLTPIMVVAVLMSGVSVPDLIYLYWWIVLSIIHLSCVFDNEVNLY